MRILLSLLLLCAASSLEAQVLSRECSASSMPSPYFYSGEMIQLFAGGVRFSVPIEWQDWNKRCHTSLRLSAAELGEVEHSGQEWEHEYTAILNATFPFREVLAHVGSEGWGEGASFFNDLQVRLYGSRRAPEEIRRTLLEQGRSEAAQFARRGVQVDTAVVPPWLRSRLSFDLWFHDYGGPTAVELFSRDCGEFTLTFAFMYVPEWAKTSVIRRILDSVSCRGEPLA